MVAAVRSGSSQRSIARQFRVALWTVQRWLERARGRRLDEVQWDDRPHVAQRVRRTPALVEGLILSVRTDLRHTSALGEYGAAAIRRELLSRGWHDVPCVRTIGRILERRGALDGRKRIRRAPPPLGWYLPDLAAREVELDSFDIIEGLVIRGGIDVEVLNCVSIHGGLVSSWPREAVTSRTAVDDLVLHWKSTGLPRYAQFDNDTRFQGPHQHRDSISRVMRLCLSLEVVPVFTPPQETGFQAAIESYNGRWQAKVWTRFQHETLASLQARSHSYVEAHRRRATARIEAAPPRRPFPSNWELDLQAHPAGKLVYLRRTCEHGYVHFLGRRFLVDGLWTHRLVRVEIQLQEGRVRFFGLRRRDPAVQALLTETTYELPRRRFSE